jgi:hypothetical protein
MPTRPRDTLYRFTGTVGRMGDQVSLASRAQPSVILPGTPLSLATGFPAEGISLPYQYALCNQRTVFAVTGDLHAP